MNAVLTPREREVIEAVIAHDSQKTAAAALGLTLQTVKNYLRQIRQKLGCETTLQAALIWDRLHL